MNTEIEPKLISISNGEKIIIANRNTKKSIILQEVDGKYIISYKDNDKSNFRINTVDIEALRCFIYLMDFTNHCASLSIPSELMKNFNDLMNYVAEIINPTFNDDSEIIEQTFQSITKFEK